jgi:hypothetical protein
MIRTMAIGFALLAALLSSGSLASAAEPVNCEASPGPACFAVESVDASLSTHQAGAHPDFFTSFAERTEPASKPNAFGLKRPYAATRDVEISLPPGLIGNPNAVGQCQLAELETFNLQGGGCPNASQVGIAKVYAYALPIAFTEPIYMMVPPGDGSAVARLGFIAGIAPTIVGVRLRDDSDYGVTASVEAANGQQELVKTETTLWGVPAAAVHDTQRQTPAEAFSGAASSPPRPPGIPPQPFMTNPTRCGKPLSVGFALDSYQEVGRFSRAEAALGQISGCDQLSFSPRLSITPTNSAAKEPTGLDGSLQLQQNETVTGLATSELRSARIVLPEGMTIAAGAADGLAACSGKEVAHTPASCPAAAKIGDVELESPALSRTLHGAVYQRTPVKDDLFGIWLVSDELGVHLKLPAEIHLDSTTGRITSSFEGTAASEGNPQLPLSDLRLHLKSGPRAPLATPSACGSYDAEFELVPWSGRPALQGQTSISFDENCAPPAFVPHFEAGSIDPRAGTFSSFLTSLKIGSGEQNLSDFELTLPSGMLAKLAGLPICEGAAAETANCPPGSQLGSATVAVGPGPSPLWLPQRGREPIVIFLGGPYKGAPYSLIVRTPAVAGPFDLGTVVTRASINLDPETTRVTVTADPLPQILEGIPIVYRAINVAIDRPEFILNPSSCRRKETRGRARSIVGTLADFASPFQLLACAELPFGPRLSLRLKGSTKRTSHPRLIANLRAEPGEANIARAQVKLPKAAFLDQAHIGAVCTRIQFAADACPAGSIYGKASAKTPLLDYKLAGPVYLRSSPTHTLPDLVVKLKGPGAQPIEIDLAGKTDSIKGALRNTFEAVPDAPVTQFHLDLFGGNRGLIELSSGLCRAPRAVVRMDGQNGKVHDTNPLVKTSCPKKHKKKRRQNKRAGSGK